MGRKNILALICLMVFIILQVVANVYAIWWLGLLSLVIFFVGFSTARKARRFFSDEVTTAKTLVIIYNIITFLWLSGIVIRIVLVIKQHP